MKNIFYEDKSGIMFNCKIVPKSSKNQISILDNETLKINVKSPPVNGKANKELISFIAKKFGLKKKDVIIVSGEKSKNKKVKILNTNTDYVLKKLRGD